MSLAILLRNDKSIGFMTSFLLHGVFILVGGFVFAKPIEYAVEAGSGGMEVSLIAAPVEPVANEAVIQESRKAIQQEPVMKDPAAMTLPQYPVEEQKEQVQTVVDSPYKGDGSSSVPGKDQTTFYSAGGAITEAKPNYLRNPAPPYPWEARQKGWQGVVILRVLVDKSGHPTSVEKEQSSGYQILDEAALKTVKHWRFRPAQLGVLPIESSVRVPIRFELRNSSSR